MRFMVYKDRKWLNFGENVIDALKSFFVSGKPFIEVEIEGIKLIFDFYCIIGIDLDTE